MAPAFGAALGSVIQDASPDTSVAFNTTATVPAGGRIFVGTTWYNAVTMSVAGGGLSWAQAGSTAAFTPDANKQAAIWTAYAPSGLASGTTITATPSGSAFALTACGGYGTGLASSSPVMDESTDDDISAAWSSGTIDTTADALFVVLAFQDHVSNAATTTGPATEFVDFQNTLDTGTVTMAYLVVTGVQSGVSIAGTWTGGSNDWLTKGVAFAPSESAVVLNIQV